MAEIMKSIVTTILFRAAARQRLLLTPQISSKHLFASSPNLVSSLKTYNCGIHTSASCLSFLPPRSLPLGAMSSVLNPQTLPSNMDCTFTQVRGYKIKGKVKRRCKSCYLIWIDGILHNLCNTHPRHKQMLKPKYWVNERILTHATMSPKRPW